MDYFFEIFVTIWEKVGEWYQYFTDSMLFSVLKVILILYVTILLVDVILLVYLSGPKKRLRAQLKGSNVPISKKKKQKEWKIIKDRLKTGKDNQYKLAVLEADHLVERALEESGYNGDNFSERLSQMPQHFSSRIGLVSQAHQLRNDIIRSDATVVTKEQVEKAVDTFEGFLKTLDVI